METELIKNYASRMSEVYVEKAFKAKSLGLSGDHIKILEDKKNFWKKITQLSPDSHEWEIAATYINLVADPKASKARKKALYKFLNERMNNKNSQRGDETSAVLTGQREASHRKS